MKWIIVRQYGKGFEMNSIRPIADAEEFANNGFEIVGEYRTKAIATTELNNMGGWIVRK
ncbi:MAG: hypothetical protein MJ191_07240 [Clostridium sp.]|nr:hypothetical protein [Clostridium sp.]